MKNNPSFLKITCPKCTSQFSIQVHRIEKLEAENRELKAKLQKFENDKKQEDFTMRDIDSFFGGAFDKKGKY